MEGMEPVGGKIPKPTEPFSIFLERHLAGHGSKWRKNFYGNS